MSTWTAPRSWVVGERATVALRRVHITNNLRFVGDSHDHGGSGGDGSQNIGPVLRVDLSTVANQGTAGRLARVGNNLVWGASNFVITRLAASTGLAALLTLGASSTAGARGTHTH